MILEILYVVTKSVPIRLTAEGRCVPRTLTVMAETSTFTTAVEDGAKKWTVLITRL